MNLLFRNRKPLDLRRSVVVSWETELLLLVSKSAGDILGKGIEGRNLNRKKCKTKLKMGQRFKEKRSRQSNDGAARNAVLAGIVSGPTTD